MLRYGFLIILFNVTVQWLSAQSKVHLQATFFTDDRVTKISVDTHRLQLWNERVFNTVESYFKTDKENRDVRVLVTLKRNEPRAFVEISARPALDEAKYLQLLELIHRQPYKVSSKLADYAYLVEVKVNNGCINVQQKYSPEISLPDEKVQIEYEASDLSGKAKLFKEWTASQVMPVVTHYIKNMPEHKIGVKAYARIFEAEDYFIKPVVELTEKSSDYWRANMEMPSGDNLVLLSRICMHIQKNEFELAQRYLNIAKAFVVDTALSNVFYKQMDFRMNWMLEDLGSEIANADMYHQEGEFESAIDYYDALLTILPRSPRLFNNKYYVASLLLMEAAPEEIIQHWQEAEGKVYACDPLFTLNKQANDSEEFYYLSRRQAIRTLFRNPAKQMDDLLTYAHIAFDLKAYGFAAQLYWLFLSHHQDGLNNKDILAYYLFSLKEMGDEENINNFEDDYVRQKYKKILKERRKAMEASPVYMRSKRIDDYSTSKGKPNRKKKKKKKKD